MKNSLMRLLLATGLVWGVGLVVCLPTSAQVNREPRPFAPGVLKVFPPVMDARDSFTIPMPVPGLDAHAFEPHFAPKAFTVFGQTQEVVFFRDVWHLEFATLGLRQIELAYRYPDGEVRTRHFWYMPYRIRDIGRSLTYREVLDDSAVAKTRKELLINEDTESGESRAPRFFPEFQLNGWIYDDNQERQVVSYRDQYLADVAREIQKLEDPHRRMYDKFEMLDQTVPRVDASSDEGLWGVAIWENVDPNIDFCSVQVFGLTNAYRMEQTVAGEVVIRRKVLQLNFYRPGDSVRQMRDNVYFGVPLVVSPAEQVEICKRYFLPGPRINAFWYDAKHGNEILLAEIDAEVSLDDFSSPVVGELNAGQLPDHLAAGLESAGVRPAGGSVKTLVAGGMWQIDADKAGESVKIELKFQPQYWEQKGKGIRFIRTIDYLWVYQ
ncbi:MAG TPA: hypothetical protein PKD54_09230 [Pirellulaceae bacterium]|nr:hypothetical protein [Pirellulaceae bacterium]